MHTCIWPHPTPECHDLNEQKSAQSIKSPSLCGQIGFEKIVFDFFLSNSE